MGETKHNINGGINNTSNTSQVKATKVIINTSNIDNSEMSFEECIIKLEREYEKNSYLEYNQENVETLLKCILVAPKSTQYPHPLIWGLFESTRIHLSVEGDCVASWAGKEAKGIKARGGGITPACT
jgi:hypothetical protein